MARTEFISICLIQMDESVVMDRRRFRLATMTTLVRTFSALRRPVKLAPRKPGRLGAGNASRSGNRWRPLVPLLADKFPRRGLLGGCMLEIRGVQRRGPGR
jgi:hypothetical protein